MWWVWSEVPSCFTMFYYAIGEALQGQQLPILVRRRSIACWSRACRGQVGDWQDSGKGQSLPLQLSWLLSLLNDHLRSILIWQSRAQVWIWHKSTGIRHLWLTWKPNQPPSSKECKHVQTPMFSNVWISDECIIHVDLLLQVRRGILLHRMPQVWYMFLHSLLWVRMPAALQLSEAMMQGAFQALEQLNQGLEPTVEKLGMWTFRRKMVWEMRNGLVRCQKQGTTTLSEILKISTARGLIFRFLSTTNFGRCSPGLKQFIASVEQRVSPAPASAKFLNLCAGRSCKSTMLSFYQVILEYFGAQCVWMCLGAKYHVLLGAYGTIPLIGAVAPTLGWDSHSAVVGTSWLWHGASSPCIPSKYQGMLICSCNLALCCRLPSVWWTAEINQSSLNGRASCLSQLGTGRSIPIPYLLPVHCAVRLAEYQWFWVCHYSIFGPAAFSKVFSLDLQRHCSQSLQYNPQLRLRKLARGI